MHSQEKITIKVSLLNYFVHLYLLNYFQQLTNSIKSYDLLFINLFLFIFFFFNRNLFGSFLKLQAALMKCLSLKMALLALSSKW